MKRITEIEKIVWFDLCFVLSMFHKYFIYEIFMKHKYF